MLSNMEEISDFEWGETFTPQWDAENIVQGSGVDQFAMFKTKEERSDEKKENGGFLDLVAGKPVRMGEIWRQSNFTSDA